MEDLRYEDSEYKKTGEVIKETSSNLIFNKAIKKYREAVGEIYCSRCPYHRYENFKNKVYYSSEGRRTRYPSWKLCSKNSRQWKKKKLEKKFSFNHKSHKTENYFTFKW